MNLYYINSGLGHGFRTATSLVEADKLARVLADTYGVPFGVYAVSMLMFTVEPYKPSLVS